MKSALSFAAAALLPILVFGAENRVLDLDGNEGFVTLPPTSFTNQTAATLECWFLFRDFSGTARVLDFGDENRELYVACDDGAADFKVLKAATPNRVRVHARGALRTNTWTHVAVVSGPGGFRVYLDGILVDTNGHSGSLATLGGRNYYLGNHNPHTGDIPLLNGQIDEVRIWRVERSPDQIKNAMFQRLTGTEPGLAGLWNFDEGDATDASAGSQNGVLHGTARTVETTLPTREGLVSPALISVRAVVPENQSDARITFSLRTGKTELMNRETGSATGVTFWTYPTSEDYTVSAISDIYGAQTVFSLEPGQRHVVRLELKPAVHIQGSVQTLDKRPVSFAFLELLDPDGEPIATGLSDRAGSFRFVNLPPGRYRLRCHAVGGYHYYGHNDIVALDTKASAIESATTFVVRADEEVITTAVQFTLPPIRKGKWSQIESTANFRWRQLVRSDDGSLLCATEEGALRYDGARFQDLLADQSSLVRTVHQISRSRAGGWLFGTSDGIWEYHENALRQLLPIPGLKVGLTRAIHQESDGTLWFFADGSLARVGVSDVQFFNQTNGLDVDQVWTIVPGKDHELWLGTEQGLFLHDGNSFQDITSTLSLGGNGGITYPATLPLLDPDGTVWFPSRSGLWHYDGEKFENWSANEGLPHENVWCVHRTEEGILWLGTGAGVSRLQDHHIVNFGSEDGLPEGAVVAITGAPDGGIWAATANGLHRFSPEPFTSYSKADGLPGEVLEHALTARDGSVWFASGRFEASPGGVSRFDGSRFQHFDENDAIPSPGADSIAEAPDGRMLFTTLWGVTVFEKDDKSLITAADGFPNGDPGSLAFDNDGVAWMATWSGGLIRTRDFKSFDAFTAEHGLLA